MTISIRKAAIRVLGALTLILTLAVFAIAPVSARTVIAAPDAATAYTCTFHWFRLADGRTIGMDIIRSDDTGRLGLRVFLVEADGTPRAIVDERPRGEWGSRFGGDAPAFATVDAATRFIGRGANWVAGAARVDDGPIKRVAFSLALEPLSRQRGFAALGPKIAHMNALDFERVRTRGTLRIDGEVFEIDSVGPAAIHAGEFLPEYAYAAMVPPIGDTENSFIVASVGSDNFKLGGAGFAYAYSSGSPSLSFRLRALEGTPLAAGSASYDLGRLRITLADVKAYPHVLLGMRTVTASALAVLRDDWTGEESPLGRIVIDFRGERFVSELPQF